MFELPTDPKKITERIKRYERGLKNDLIKFGSISDGAGKRYILGTLYLMSDDPVGAIKSYEWLAEQIEDDSGEPFDLLVHSLTLFLLGENKSASRKLIQADLSNLHLVPTLLKYPNKKLDIEYGSNMEEKEYLDYLSGYVFPLWKEDALKWAKESFDGTEHQSIRNKYIAMSRKLNELKPGPQRTKVVKEMYELLEDEGI